MVPVSADDPTDPAYWTARYGFPHATSQYKTYVGDEFHVRVTKYIDNNGFSITKQEFMNEQRLIKDTNDPRLIERQRSRGMFEINVAGTWRSYRAVEIGYHNPFRAAFRRDPDKLPSDVGYIPDEIILGIQDLRAGRLRVVEPPSTTLSAETINTLRPKACQTAGYLTNSEMNIRNALCDQAIEANVLREKLATATDALEASESRNKYARLSNELAQEKAKNKTRDEENIRVNSSNGRLMGEVAELKSELLRANGKYDTLKRTYDKVGPELDHAKMALARVRDAVKP